MRLRIAASFLYSWLSCCLKLCWCFICTKRSCKHVCQSSPTREGILILRNHSMDATVSACCQNDPCYFEDSNSQPMPFRKFDGPGRSLTWISLLTRQHIFETYGTSQHKGATLRRVVVHSGLAYPAILALHWFVTLLWQCSHC